MLQLVKYSLLSLALAGLMTASGYAQTGSENTQSTQPVMEQSGISPEMNADAQPTQVKDSTMQMGASVSSMEPSEPCTYAYSQAYGNCEGAGVASKSSLSDADGGGGAGGR